MFDGDISSYRRRGRTGSVALGSAGPGESTDGAVVSGGRRTVAQGSSRYIAPTCVRGLTVQCVWRKGGGATEIADGTTIPSATAGRRCPKRGERTGWRKSRGEPAVCCVELGLGY